MIRFILNDNTIVTDQPAGLVLLDFIRYQQRLMGTKIGCREGDCGACTVLIGSIKNGALVYESMTSCLLPIGNVNGKHVLTIEGINLDQLNLIQQAMADEGATQCGFCTPGFVMSLAGFCLSGKKPDAKEAIAAIDGNICRCTGYKSIERAASRLAAILQERGKEDLGSFLINKKILPAYLQNIKTRLIKLEAGNAKTGASNGLNHTTYLAGGTDLYVQKPEELKHSPVQMLFNDLSLKGIRKEGNRCIIGPSATVTDLKMSEILNQALPQFQRYIKLVSSTPIRNMATVAGNFINASPIGDLTVFFLALNAEISFSIPASSASENGQRKILLRNLYRGYKQLDKKPGEYISSISFELPGKDSLFHFEKLSKRTHLDIATVNTAIQLIMDGDLVKTAFLSAGGVAPVPLFLEKTSAFLLGKTISVSLLNSAIEVMNTEISPISDARGSAEYKKLLLGQLVKAHFIELFPTLKVTELLNVSEA